MECRDIQVTVAGLQVRHLGLRNGGHPEHARLLGQGLDEEGVVPVQVGRALPEIL
jgi:hypothetical protein